MPAKFHFRFSWIAAGPLDGPAVFFYTVFTMKRTLTLGFSLTVLAASVQATEWHVLGPRAMGMGGAGVALAQGPVGAYWNPAGLGQTENPSGIQVPIGMNLELTGQFLEGANDFHDISKDCPAGARCTQANINLALSKMNRADNGLRGDFSAGTEIKIKRVAVFVNNFSYFAGIPRVDMTNKTPANIGQGLNLSKLVLRGIQVTEIGAGYGQELPFAPGLLVGGNLKALIGKAGYYDLLIVANSPDSSDALRKYLNGSKTNVQPGIDLGLLWDVNRTFESVPLRPRVGITGRNINNPRFSNPDQAKLAGERDKYSLQGNARLGLAVSPFRFWNIAADADLTRNPTPVDGVASQMVSLGSELNIFNRDWLNIPLRAGIMRNMADAGSKTAFTGGFGLNFLHFTADIAAKVTPATQPIRSQEREQKIPTAIGISAQIGLLFGGGPEDSPPKPEKRTGFTPKK